MNNLSDKPDLIVPLTVDEFSAISQMISKENSVFQALWRSCQFFWDQTIPTAQVEYDSRSGSIALRINPFLWEQSSTEGKRFILLHEGFHLVFDHFGIFSKIKFENFDPVNLNKAQDIPINHFIEDSYVPGCREEFKFELCFVDTVFKGTPHEKAPTNETWQYYYALMPKSKEQPQKGPGAFDGQSPTSVFGEDSPVFNFSELPEELQEEIKQASKEAVAKSASSEDILEIANKFPKGKQAGSDPLGALISVANQKVQKNRKWEDLVKDMLASMYKVKYKDKLSWVFRNRASFALSDKDCILPGELEQKVRDVKEKFKIVAFLDTSGSCYSQAQRFFNLIKTMPEDLFDIEVFSFDTRIYPVDIKKGSLRGGGGTCFRILDEEIRRRETHPDVVFVITDGEASRISPLKPKKWIWLLTQEYFSAIPSESKKVLLRKFE